MSQAQKLHVNILSPEFHINPYPFYKQLREQEPVYWSEETRHWLITRYEDVQTALRDASRFSSQSSETFVVRDDFMQHLRPIITHFSMWAVMKDNPEHKRLRRKCPGSRSSIARTRGPPVGCSFAASISRRWARGPGSS